MHDQKALLIKILDAIDFKDGEKESFAEMFIGLIFEESIYNLIQSLPEAKRKKVGEKWDNNTNNKAALESLLTHYFTEDQIKTSYQKTAEKAVLDYLTSKGEEITPSQREKLRILAGIDTTKGGPTHRKLVKN